MSLPAADIAWDDLAIDLKGLRIGLHLDAGLGMDVEPEVRAAIERAATLFEGEGAVIEPLRPFLERSMLEGLDAFWRQRSWADIGALSDSARAKVLPYILAWAEGGRDLSGATVYEGMSQMGTMRDATLAATGAYDFVLSPVSPVPAYPAGMASPLNDPQKPFEHICFTVPYNFSEQPAASVNAGFTRSGLPIGLQIAGRRFDDLGVLRLSAAFERIRGVERPWPRP